MDYILICLEIYSNIHWETEWRPFVSRTCKQTYENNILKKVRSWRKRFRHKMQNSSLSMPTSLLPPFELLSQPLQLVSGWQCFQWKTNIPISMQTPPTNSFSAFTCKMPAYSNSALNTIYKVLSNLSHLSSKEQYLNMHVGVNWWKKPTHCTSVCHQPAFSMLKRTA